MSLSEQTVISSVEILPKINAINVLWENQILRDGNVISTELVRRAYGRYERDMFLSDVPNGESYADSAGLEVMPAVADENPDQQVVTE